MKAETKAVVIDALKRMRLSLKSSSLVYNEGSWEVGNTRFQMAAIDEALKDILLEEEYPQIIPKEIPTFRVYKNKWYWARRVVSHRGEIFKGPFETKREGMKAWTEVYMPYGFELIRGEELLRHATEGIADRRGQL